MDIEEVKAAALSPAVDAEKERSGHPAPQPGGI